MKKQLKFSLLFVVLGLTLGLSSCKKVWTCECKDASGAVETFPISGIKSTKAVAQSLCDLGSFDGYTCKVK